MKTAAEVLEKWRTQNEWIGITYSRDNILKAMEEYASQSQPQSEAVEFGKWINRECWVPSHVHIGQWEYLNGVKVCTTAQLYAKFKGGKHD